MSCNKIQSKLSAYLDGEMSGVEMLQMRTHVNTCRECQTELHSLQTVQSMLREFPSVPEPSADFVDQFQAKLTRSRKNYLGFALAIALPAVCWFVFSSTRPNHPQMRDRDAIISDQFAKDQMLDTSSDPAIGASLVHYTNFEAR